MIDYSGLNGLLKTKGIKKSELGILLGISSRTIAKISKGEKLSKKTIKRICAYLECEPEQLFEEIPENALLQTLREEKAHGISGGIYHELQIRMTYNSNHIEGSRLSEDQTRMIFETNTIDNGDGVSVDDILETIHHFRAIDYCIDIAEEPLTEAIIKNLHYILKHDTKDSRLPWFAVGDYKTRPNYVGGCETVSPSQVQHAIRDLLSAYQSIKKVSFEDIIAFHASFEKIHPFSDGNGRVGRLIAFKECLKHKIVPFIIEDNKKSFYYRGLSNWNTEKGFLIETCLDGQDTVDALLKQFKLTEDNCE